MNDTRRETLEGQEYFVVPVTAMKAMNLTGGYVPAEHVKRSELAWNGEPVTLNHPTTANGDLTSANSPEMAEKTLLGRFFNVSYDPDTTELNGEIWYNIESLTSKAPDVLEKLENEEPIAVSTAYYGDRLPSGEYDGEYRERVIGNI